MPDKLRSRRGFALPVAIGAIVLVGMMLAGVFFATTQDARVGLNTETQEVATRASEAGLTSAFAKWTGKNYGTMPVGSTTVVVDTVPLSAGAVDTARVTKLYTNAFLITSVGRAGTNNGGNARRRTQMVVKLSWPVFNFLGALTVRGAIQIGGSSNINGNDQAPTGWPNCPPLQSAVAAIATNDTTNVTFSGCNNYSCLSGSPLIKVSASAADSNTYFSYGDATWNTLAAQANLNFSGSQTMNGIGPDSSGTTCLTGQTYPQNWGNTTHTTPTGTCQTWFPIIHFSDTTATVTLTGGSGQGILLVDGDLAVSGGFTFYGPVIVRGHLKTTGTGGHFYGGVLAGNVDLEQNTVLGNAIINTSSCAVQAAIQGSGVGQPANARPWAEVF